MFSDPKKIQFLIDYHNNLILSIKKTSFTDFGQFRCVLPMCMEIAALHNCRTTEKSESDMRKRASCHSAPYSHSGDAPPDICLDKKKNHLSIDLRTDL